VPGFLTDAREILVPRAGSAHGPLPPLLLSMTLVTGLVDAFSYLMLGHVFVANMTGNVVFLGFALAGAPGFSAAASLTALAAFGLGALAGGWLAARHSGDRGRLHSSAATAQAGCLAAGLVLAVAAGQQPGTGYRYPLIVALGLAMGLQNAAARKIAVPDLTTTVLTLTITGIAADSTLVGGPGSKAARRLLSVLTMFAGALAGAALALHVRAWIPLALAFAAIAVGAMITRTLGSSDPSWVHAPA